MQALEKIIGTLSSIAWGPPMLILLVGTGLYLTILLKGVQFRALPHALKLIFNKDHHHEGDISHFAALTTALAATVGTGNIAGVALAITIGGPGAVFWMWVTGLVGMATKYSEAVLAIKYREKGAHGMRGGPMYYLAKGAGLPWLGTLFAIFTAFAAFGIGNMMQANATAGVLHSTFNIPTEATGIVLMLLTGLVILGGIRTIGKFTSYLVPFMIVLYVGSCLIVLAINVNEIPHALGLIFYHAFNPSAASGGFIGATVATAISVGVARGVFSNESGLGSAPIAAAAARTNDPVKQALVSMTQTFIDTLVVCTMTALVILTASSWTQKIEPTALTSVSMAETLGSTGSIIVAIATALFAYSTLIGWNYYGEKAIEYLFGERAIRIYRVFFIVAVMVGSVVSLKLVLNFSDLMNALMAIPNLIGLLLLSKIIKQETDRYFTEVKK
ncbi:sodium:alanine symporter family protein [Methylotenera sp.]|uniref:alanine/glycine:cation symporter family protein n=3 Tax=Methylotenera sp. TaxID=2051956 RepID=UPI002721A596|nr:sodium:alanine symporter family protein [Methylotenera sp.]MDO9204278.1 sodium:alanine symporter family protein [Methylotenera sp.]MDP1523143.1 sodium:alanine symporter family protein [Methylotenera sp.]MDP2070118.1 sodium:alanine symporter family protein [Methylotenera sp.]MDP2229959.1 sodium:alanine symporter family protein [Methylotenera sp.]MDP3005705.1 sodium:alanine symporter family protein [Methylotenera sp.]